MRRNLWMYFMKVGFKFIEHLKLKLHIHCSWRTETKNIFSYFDKHIFVLVLFLPSPLAGVRAAELRGVRGRRLPHLHGLEGQPHRRLQRPRPAHRLEDAHDDDDADDDSDTEVGNITNILLNTLLPHAASPQCSAARGAVSSNARQSQHHPGFLRTTSLCGLRAVPKNQQFLDLKLN